MSRLRPALFLAFGLTILKAGDYDALLSAMKRAWPDRVNLAVVCDVNYSKSELEELKGAMGGMKLMVCHARGPQDMGKIIIALSGPQKPDAIVLLAKDHTAGDGTPAAGFLIQRMATFKVPVAALTEAGVKQGAALAIGPGTGGKLLSNAKVAAVAGVAVPAGATSM